jgi:hypothetical protein
LVVVGRVEWRRYEGNDIEAVVAMMLNREHPDSVQITPSQGDGGVDILDRGAADDGDVVYQVKRYSAPLNAGQKGKIVRSAKRLLDSDAGDPRWKDLNVAVWRLVTPWNPTPEAETWLQESVGPYGVKVVWDGLTLIDQLAAKYPDVIDYYLHGGRSTIKAAYAEAMTLMSLSTAGEGDLPVSEVTERIERALGILDHDPHYLYEVAFSRDEPPEPPSRPGLVMTYYRVDPTASTWQTINVIARCAASADARPITLSGTLSVEGNPEFAAAVKEFFEFGTPFTSPEGAYSATIDAPGGFGGELVDATIATIPAEGEDLGSDTELRLEILDPDGIVIAQADVDRTDRSSGTAGIRVVLVETYGVFELTFRANLSNQTAHMHLGLLSLEGIPISAALPALEFLAAFHHPNTYRITVRHTPSHLGATDKIPEPLDPTITERMRRLAKGLRLLNDLQQHTRTVITVPDLSRYVEDQRKAWYLVATILKGRPVIVSAPEGSVFHLVLPPGTPAPTGSFAIRMPLQAPIGTQLINFGTLLAEFTDAELLAESESEDGQPVFAYMTPDRKVRYLPDVEAQEADSALTQSRQATESLPVSRARSARS